MKIGSLIILYLERTTEIHRSIQKHVYFYEIISIFYLRKSTVKKSIISFLIFTGLGLTGVAKTEGIEKINIIDIDIGKKFNANRYTEGNIQYDIETSQGLTFYKFSAKSPGATVHYARPGYEIDLEKTSSLVMIADPRNDSAMAIREADLTFYPQIVKTEEEARALIVSLSGRFRRKQWQRYITDLCPAVSGRSSFLDEYGMITGECPLDPTYDPSPEDWTQLMKIGMSYVWLGGGILASVFVSFDEDAQGITCNINLTFEDLAMIGRMDLAIQADQLKRYEAEGLPGRKLLEKEEAERKAELKLLEKNAVRRGDHLVPRN